MVKVVIVDCQITGISGDKFLASLVDMGNNFKKLNPLISNLSKNHPNCSSFEVKAQKELINGFNCTKLRIQIDEKKVHLTRKDALELIELDIEGLNLSDKAKKFIFEAFDIIFNAEAHVHQKSPQEIHLHEIGSVDTFFDLIGSAILLDDLNLLDDTSWKVLPIAVGSGKIKISHGMVSTPAPATLKIIQDHEFVIRGVNIKSELTTPTGISILASLGAKSTNKYPPILIKNVGYGGGIKNFEEHPNIIRLISGILEEGISLKDMISVLETNVDDVSGEILGDFIINMTNMNGLKDISLIPSITKKNRPGYLIKILADPKEQEIIEQKVFEQLGTLGIRHYYCERNVLNREMIKKGVKIGNREFMIRFKYGYLNDGSIVNVKPEYEDIKKIAKEIKKPFLEVLKLINKQIETI